MTAAHAERVILEWASRGLVLWNDLETKSTRTRRVCPRCFSGVRERPLGYDCAAGCGWETVRPDTEGL